MKPTLPNIFSYNDFRKYLADYHQARNAIDRRFTKSAFSQMLDLPNTRSYINDVLKGKKVTPTFIERFIKAMKLPKDEANYFRALIHYNQATSPHEQELFFDRLISLNKTPRTIIEKQYFAYYRHWYNSLVRALLEVIDFKDDYTALTERIIPKLTPKQIKESLVLLKKAGMVTTDDNGFLRPTEKSISSSDYSNEECIRNYQLQLFEASITALLHAGKVPHQLSTNTFSISPNGYKRIQKIVERFRSQIRSAIHKDADEADRIYQITVALSPMTK